MSRLTILRSDSIDSHNRVHQVLTATPVFGTLPAKILATVASQLAPRAYVAGQVICTEGDAATSLFLLETGWVKGVRITEGGREQAIIVLRGGEIFGAESVFTRAPYPWTVIALEATAAWTIDNATLKSLTGRHPALAIALLEHLGARACDYIQLVEDLSLRNVPARLAWTLLSHAESQGGELIVPRRSWSTLDEIAARLGTVRDVLSRALSTLESEGLLRLERHQIVLIDPVKLRDRGRA